MPISIKIDDILKLAPKIIKPYADGLKNIQQIFDSYNISENPLRVAHFFAQVLHECSSFTIQYENLNYSEAGLVATWPSRFKAPVNPAEYAKNPQKIANYVYARKELGNINEGDGWLFRGRGLLQTTGRSGYKEMTNIVRKYNINAPDFEANPDLVLSPDWCFEVAAAEFKSKKCNEYADKDDIIAVTKAINGGIIGLDDRKLKLIKTKEIWHI